MADDLLRPGLVFEPAQRVSELRRLTEGAATPKSESRNSKRKVKILTPGPFMAPLTLDSRAPLATARVFLERSYTADGRRTLYYHRGAFFSWTGSHYPLAENAKLRSEIYEFLDSAVKPGPQKARFKPNRSTVGDVVDAMKAASHLSKDVQPPVWLGEAVDLPANEIIACANGLLHLPTLELLPHSPDFFSLNSLPFGFDAEAPGPQTWLGFLDSLWGSDTEAIRILQEVFGYFLGGDTTQQKIFLLVGPKRSGKGTIARVLTGMLGAENVAAPTLSSLATNFGLAPLIGRPLAIISDARLGARADQAAIAERLLSISGEDSITIDRKHLDAWTGRLSTRFLILTNELPRIADTSGALASRFIVLTLHRSFYGFEDPTLTDRLLAELPRILRWAIDGWARLRERGYFLQPSSSAEAIRELEDLGSPINVFLRNRCTIESGAEVAVANLFNTWCDWCKEQGRDHPGTVQTFGRDLRAAMPGLRTKQLRDGDGRDRVYLGLKLRR